MTTNVFELKAPTQFLIVVFFFGFALQGNGQEVPVLEWAKNFGGSSVEGATSVKADASGNVYVVGYFSSSLVDFDPGPGTVNLSLAGSQDGFVSKFDPNGNLLWARALEVNYIADIEIDNAGNVYTTGYFSNTVDFNPGAGTFNLTSAGSYDAFILKLTTNGDFVWAGSVGGSFSDYGNAIDLDNSGNVFITGYFFSTPADFDPGAGIVNLSSTGDTDVFVLKLDNNGIYQWARQFGGVEDEKGHTLAIDGLGNVVITGQFYGYTAPFDFDPGPATVTLTQVGSLLSEWDIYICKLDNATGNISWAKSISAPRWDVDEAMTIDNLDNILLTGHFFGTADFDPDAGIFQLTSSGIADPFIAKLNSSGNFIWAKSMAGSSTADNYGHNITTDAVGNVYTCGSFEFTMDADPGSAVFNLSAGGSRDAYVSKLDVNGNFVWAYKISSGSFDQGNSIALDPLGKVYTTGYFTGTADFDPGACTANLTSNGSSDAFLQKITAGAVHTISSFSPGSGSVGTTVTISGTNFSTIPSNNTVAFNGITSVVSASTATSITTTVPTGAATGKISVNVNCTTVVSSLDFIATDNFVTRWNLATAGSGATQLSFGTATSGVVNYTWQQLPTGLSGNGSWSGATLTLTGLPTGATIRLQIAPTNFQRININNGTDRNRLTQVEQWGTTAWTSMQTAFRNCLNLQITATDIPNLTGVSNMSEMFSGCDILNSPSNIGSWNTGVVTTMQRMFANTDAFNQNIGAWNTAAVTNMSEMFSSARAFNQPVGGWSTAAVTNMSGMFFYADVFNQDIGAWNTSAVTNMSDMFTEAFAFNQNIGAWNTAGVTNMASMFSDAIAFNQNISSWNTAAVTNMSGMFKFANVFNQNIGAWNTAAVTTMSQMFSRASAFNQNLSSWNTGAVTSMLGMFEQATAFNQNIGAWTLNPGVDLRFMFDNNGLDCNNYSATLIGWSASPSTPNGRTLGATGRQYGTNAVAARNDLDITKSWTITGDTPSGAVCSSVPTITNFTPATGPIGTTVTITGTNFSTTTASNIVYFGAVQAPVTAATSTQLTVTVPTGATFKPISVSVSGLIATASQPFIVSFASGGQIDNCSFTPAIAIGTVSTSSFNSALCDLDGDGKIDLLIPEFSSNQLAIFRNTSVSGTASFAPKIPLTGLTQALSTAVGDLDGDGKPDIAVANYTNGQLSVYKNLSTPGTISVATRVTYSIPAFTDDVLIADIDGDGKQDLIISASIQGMIVMRNQGSPGVIDATSFAAGVTFATGANAYPIALGDLDGDGKLDAIVPNANTYTLSVFRNTSTPGTVSFAASVTLTTNTGTPTAGFGTGYVSLGDIDGDSKLDIVAVSNTVTKLSIFRNTSTPGSLTFDPRFDIATTGIGAAPPLSDLNGDGKLDLVADNGPSQMLVFESTASSGAINATTFKTPVIIPRASSYIPQLGDVDCDGRNDIISTATNVQVFRNLVGEISPPTIASFSPTSGIVGATVTITGTNFSTLFAKTVEFNGMPATVTGSTATTLTVTVPVGATTGPVKVTIGCNTVTGSNFTVGAPATITISNQPTDFTACFGQTPIATFATSATGTTNIIYQWQRQLIDFTFDDVVEGGAYSGSNTPTLMVNTGFGPVSLAYRCRINGDFASQQISNTASLLTVFPPLAPSIIAANRCGPGSVTLTASGGSNGQYRWYTVASGGTAIAGETNSSYVTPSLTATTSYYVSLNTNGCESTRTLVAAILTITPPPTATGVSGCLASALTLTASGGANGQYNWYTVSTGGTAIAGATNNTYPISSLTVTSTFYVSLTISGCESTRTPVTATLLSIGCAPVITTQTLTAQLEGKIEINLQSLITTPGTLDPTSIKVITQPASGAVASITNFLLVIDYKGKPFSGKETIIIEACNTNGLCTQQTFTIEVAGEVIVFNAVSPNGDGKNEFLVLQYIESISPKNQVSIYNRWGDEVFSISNYDNKTRVFAGLTSSGGKIPSGTYFYKIALPNVGKTLTGFIDLRY